MKPLLFFSLAMTLAACSFPPAAKPGEPDPAKPGVSDVRMVPADKHVWTGTAPHGIGYAANRVFICNIRSSTLGVVNARTGEREPDLAVQGGPGYTTVSADERLVAVSNEASGSVSIIDPTVPKVLRHVEGVGSIPDKLKFTPDGKVLYVALGGEAGVARIDWQADPPVSKKIMAGPADGLREMQLFEGLGLVPDTGGETVTLIDLATDNTRQLPAGPKPKATALATFVVDGQTQRVLAVGSRGDGKARLYSIPAGTLLETLDVGPKPFEAVALGRMVFMSVSDANLVSVIDTAARKVVATIAVGRKPSHVFLAPRGGSGPANQVWVGCDQSTYASVIDADRNVLYANAEAQGGHHTVAFSSDGTRAFISNLASDSVSIIDRTKL